MRLAEIISSAAAAVCVAAILGCGGTSNPTTYPVTGTVTQGSTPVEGATVVFIPADAVAPGSASGTAKSAVGVTDSAGKYALTTFMSDDGAVPGEFKVRVFKYDTPQDVEPVEPAPAPASGEMVDMGDNYQDPSAQAEASDEPKSLLPEKYALVSETPLQHTVTEGENVYDIALDAK